MLGWSVVVKKGDFQVGDLAVYFEIDSFLSAENPAFATFEERFTNWGTKRGMRLKTIKLRKQISQGLLMPLGSFAELSAPGNPLPAEGDDVTDLLKIEKWEPAEETRSNGGPNKTAGAKPFPSFIQKTDQERVQNYMNELPKHMSETFEVTVKLDGSSMTVFHVGNSSPHFDHVHEDMDTRVLKKLKGWKRLVHKLKAKLGVGKPLFYDGVCSRNIQLGINDDNHFSTFVREHGMLEALENMGRNIAVQGELLAPSIQANHEQVKGFEFYVFDIFDIDAQAYLKPAEAREVVATLGWNYVPVLDTVSNLSYFEHEAANGDPEFNRHTVDMILAYAEGPGMNKGVKREGIVFKSNETPFSFKAISTSYLLKKG